MSFSATVFTRDDGVLYQVVQAHLRGDRCYEGKRGWYFHHFDENFGILESSVNGPHHDADACFRAAEVIPAA